MEWNRQNSARATVAIPLYQSLRFLDSIIANIEALPGDVEVLVSDRHCYDDTIDRLADHFSGDIRVKCFRYKDEIDWIGNINFLLKQSESRYWQFLPHDDISPPGSLERLIQALDCDPDAILAYGPIEPVSMDGTLLKERMRPIPPPEVKDAKENWSLDLVLPMFWKWYFTGAFKGLVRRSVLMEHDLFIRSTRDQIYPERCWLFALGLLGHFHFVPLAKYRKRFYEGSLHSSWKIKGINYINAAWVMNSYLYDLVPSIPAKCYGARDLWLNARRRAWWKDNRIGPNPSYLSAPDNPQTPIRQFGLPMK